MTRPTPATNAPDSSPGFEHARVLMVGVGGLGCAAAVALAGARLGKLILVDEDVVDESNLHRQVLYGDADLGRAKLEAARDALIGRGMSAQSIELRSGRLLPENARAWVRDADVVLEGADNYATKFLVADACHLEQRAVVHGAAVRWKATVLSVLPEGKPCYRCVFEDLPAGPTQNCDSAGVMGPVVGFAGALMAEHALRTLSGDPFMGLVHTFDGLRAQLRTVSIHHRRTCPLCGPDASISEVAEERYLRAATDFCSISPLPQSPNNPNL